MKHEEIYDKHADRTTKPKRKKFKEGVDRDARHRRIGFKNYVRQLEENLLEDDLPDDEPAV